MWTSHLTFCCGYNHSIKTACPTWMNMNHVTYQCGWVKWRVSESRHLLLQVYLANKNGMSHMIENESYCVWTGMNHIAYERVTLSLVAGTFIQYRRIVTTWMSMSHVTYECEWVMSRMSESRHCLFQVTRLELHRYIQSITMAFHTWMRTSAAKQEWDKSCQCKRVTSPAVAGASICSMKMACHT